MRKSSTKSIGTCEARRQKAVRYLSAANPSGFSYQKCGRRAVIISSTGKLLCVKCSERLPEINSLGSVSVMNIMTNLSNGHTEFPEDSGETKRSLK